ncbi:MAG TPA: hypothetical protein PK847_06540 [Candidatus Sumerlaeota bacterium]|nr:hypothetical protein [Candidatus Sumerlaeota bacterium]HOR28183.1 hypothetical protein [Candidatus Sumerlaeota bacterium]
MMTLTIALILIAALCALGCFFRPTRLAIGILLIILGAVGIVSAFWMFVGIPVTIVGFSIVYFEYTRRRGGEPAGRV